GFSSRYGIVVLLSVAASLNFNLPISHSLRLTLKRYYTVSNNLSTINFNDYLNLAIKLKI
ncbi:MAG: hypothetical protein VYD40_01225, partial [Chloroflexota bacterium]|nr:hypothetical protein [Chloroflexota bacterium]